MKFTTYFSRVLKDKGTPDINVNEYSRMLNIIILENQIEILRKVQMKERDFDRRRFLITDIMRLQTLLDRLTMENKPEHLLRYMLNEARFEN